MRALGPQVVLDCPSSAASCGIVRRRQPNAMRPWPTRPFGQQRMSLRARSRRVCFEEVGSHCLEVVLPTWLEHVTSALGNYNHNLVWSFVLTERVSDSANKSSRRLMSNKDFARSRRRGTISIRTAHTVTVTASNPKRTIPARLSHLDLMRQRYRGRDVLNRLSRTTGNGRTPA